MQHDIIFSGFGGQGALFAGQLLAYAALGAGRNVTWIPSYGPEMRGGTAHCTVIVSDQAIGSPLVRHPSNVVALNNPSVEKYEPLLAPGGCLIYNASLVTRLIERGDIRAVAIPASDVAAELGDRRLLNMVMLGALLDQTGVLPLAVVERAIEEHLPERHRGLLELNRQALRRGRELAGSALQFAGS
ncbi:MAG TPA: 2-oxoacid:acceptor oxidoreductase family protein [Roseiflexaceae bacterium]|nr:2-oxoacid:acceptor oxidoreductase family protein [Roseiflexaceae bacterium]